MSNPVLSERYFGIPAGTPDAALAGSPPPQAAGYRPAPGVTDTSARTMTMGGVASATAVMLIFVLAGGWYGWGQVEVTDGLDSLGRTVQVATFPVGWVMGSVLVGFVLAMICCFKPPLARFLAIPYSIAEGVFLGAISHTYDVQTEGIALQAVIATAAVFGIMLALYGFRVLRVTPRMTKAIIASTFGIMAVYLVGFVASLFGADLRFWDSASPLSIGLSFVIVGVAAFNLLLDFDFIERGVAARLPKEMEWFGAFGLVVTLVWLYLELLRLLSKLNRR